MGRFKVDEAHLLNSIRKRAKELDVDLDLEVRETKAQGDCREIALEASNSGSDVVAVAGGDGTIFEAVNSLKGKGSLLGIIPIGSGNDDIVSISGHNDRDRCIDDILTGKGNPIDIGSMNGTYFLNVVGLGLDAEVNHRVARNREHVKLMGAALTYTFAAFKVLLKFKPYKIEFSIDGKDMGERSISLCTIGNGTTCGGGYKLTPLAKMDDGLLDLSISAYLGKLRSIRSIGKAFKGDHIKIEGNIYENFRKAVIKGVDRELPFHMDGEAGFAERIEFEIIPDGIEIVHPIAGS